MKMKTMIDIALDPNDFAIRLGRGFKTDCERVAHEIRDKLQLPRHDRLKARRLAHCLQVRIRTPADLSWRDEAHHQEHMDLVNKHWSAFLIHPPGYQALIIANPNNTLQRQESDIFHELAHLLCRHSPRGIKKIGGIPMWHYDKEQEEQAEFLGYALHLPKDGLFLSVKSGLDNQAIGIKYRASERLVQHRVNLTHVRHILRRVS